jgi:protein-tyrosine phosphatase
MCGKHAVGADPEGALARVGATTMVCLNERYELEDRYPEYVRWLDEAGADRALWHPIPDLHAPPLTELRPFLDELVARLDGGAALVVHCGAGFGRAGTVVACVLILMGVDRARALRIVAEHRPMAGPEAGPQRDVIDDLAAQLAD